MNIDEEQRYEHTMEEIIFQFENLIMNILFVSIKKLNIDYEQVLMKVINPEEPDDIEF